MKCVKICNKIIGDGNPCFIMAEAGSNHNGNMEQAKKMIELAAEAGADAIKFQLFKAEKIYVSNPGVSDYLKMDKSIFDVLKSMELPHEFIPEIAKHCKKNNIIFISSVFDEKSADIVEEYISAFKIASYELNHIPLIKHCAKKGKPMMISTGTGNMKEVEAAVEACKEVGNDKIILMQCTACYPCPIDSANLRAIQTLKNKFGFPAGLSDHTRDPYVAPIVSTVLGSNIIEKHYTLSNNLPGADQRFSVEPHELKNMVNAIRSAESSMGSGIKEPLPAENELFHFAKRGIHATSEIKKGDKFTKENIAVLRPGKLERGIEPSFYDRIIGKVSKRNIKKDEGIKKGDF